MGLLVVAMTMLAGPARADGPATSWSSISAGQQTRNAYDTLTSYQKAQVIYTATPPSMPSPGGNPIYTYSDWTTTGSSASEFEDAAGRVLGQAKRFGRFRPALRTLGVLTVGTIAFDIGWRYGSGNSFWHSVTGALGFGGSTQASGSTSCSSVYRWYFYKAWKYVSAGTYIDGTVLRAATSGWYLSWAVTQDPGRWILDVSNANPTCEAIPKGLVPSDLLSKASVVHPLWSNGSTATGYDSFVITEAGMDGPVVSVGPEQAYTNQTGAMGNLNTGTYTVPSDQGNASDVAASDGFIAPSTSWSDLTPQQKALIPILVLRANPTFAPIADQQTMPNCVGLTQSACNAALDNIAATGIRTYTIADINSADLTKPAGAVIAQWITAGSSFDRTASLTFTKNPDPLPIVWPEPARNETYSSYVQRLRDLGWLGEATVIDLDSSRGNVDYGLDGVPCTSVASGSRISVDGSVTFLHNPVTGSFDENLNPSSGITCGDATPSSQSEPPCSFHQEIGSWEDISQNNPLFYQLACESTRSYIASLSPFDEDGTINSGAIAVARDIADGDQIYGADVKKVLLPPGGAYSINDFKYVASQILTDPEGREFEIHFYVNKVTGKAVFSLGYKIRYLYYFAP